MCGIVGYIGTRPAAPMLIKGLHQLEYRGYDSAGIALNHEDNQPFIIYKEKGKVSNLETAVINDQPAATVGIGHTRWATHGEPSTTNAHPHLSMSGEIVIVHNGIIENYKELKEQLERKGYEFKSQTDTEVLCNLIDYVYQRNGRQLMAAVSRALYHVIGAYAIVVMECKDSSHVVCARKASPLVIGISEDNTEYFIGSDATPMVEYTKRVVYLDDGQIADVRRGEDINLINLSDHSAADVNVKEINLDIAALSKGGYPHYMIKEIFDQPRCMRDCMRGRIVRVRDYSGNGEHYEVHLSALKNFKAKLIRARHVIIVACGTSWHAGLIGKHLIEQMCRIRVEVEYASEFRYSNPVVEKDDVVIAISQSGETADTLAAIQLAKEKGALVFGIVNGVGSSIARETDTGIYIHVGPEIGVASTKAFTGQVTVLAMLALALGNALGTISEEEYQQTCHELTVIPDKINQILEQNDRIKELSTMFADRHNALYLGRGFNYPVALEGALKLKEISYIHAEGYPAAEMKHGPLALVDEHMPIVFVATHQGQYQKIISTRQEVQSRKGRIPAIVSEGDSVAGRICEHVIEIPHTLNALVPLLSVIPMQMLAYHVAVAKGLNVDMPRNLAKSVTVE